MANRIKSFHATLAEFREESRAAKMHNEKALIAINGFNIEEILKFKLEEERILANFSSHIKRLWINAIKKVIFRNRVDKVKRHLAAIEERSRSNINCRGKDRRIRNTSCDYTKKDLKHNAFKLPAVVLTTITSQTISNHLKDVSADHIELDDTVNSTHGVLLPSVSKHVGGTNLNGRAVLQRSNSRVMRNAIRREGFRIDGNINSTDMSRLSPSNSDATLKEEFKYSLNANESAIPSIAQSYRAMSARNIYWLADEESDKALFDEMVELRNRPILHTSKSLDCKSRRDRGRSYE